MNETYIFWICIIVGIIVLLILSGLILFGTTLIKKTLLNYPLNDTVTGTIITKLINEKDIQQHFENVYKESLQRRNEFLISYGQIIVAVLIALVLTILLLTKSISAEAGLPILSGISGFVLAKSVSGSKSANVPKDQIIKPDNKENV